MTQHIAEVIEDEDGELAIQIPLEVINQMGWAEDTLLEWIEDIPGQSYYLKEKKDAE